MWPGSTGKRNLNDFTTPNCQKWNGGNSNVILHNISDPAETMTAIFGNKWFGNFPLDLTWKDNIELGGDVEVNNGLTLTIETNTFIQFSSGTRLTINGTLYADGATFSSASSNPGSGDWYGIVFDNADNNSYIKNSTIEYATYGIECIDCSPIISESGKPNTIQYNSSNGVRCHQASPAISYNTIQHNGIGIYCEYNSNPDIAQNYVIDNNSYGIFCTQTCNPYIRHNEVSNNGIGGIACLNSSSPNLIGKSSNEPYGANKIISNGGNGVMSQSNSDPNLGFHLGYQAGYNDIYDNSNYQVANYTSNTIYAWKNWWGTSNPGSGLFTGSVDYSDYLLSSSPYAGPDWGSSLAKTFSDYPENTLNEAEEYLQRALELEGSAAYEEAVAAYRYVADNYGDSEYGSFALARLMACRVKQGDITVEKDYLISLFQKYNLAAIGRSALLWQPLVEVRSGNEQRAFVLFDEIKNNYSDENLLKQALFQKASL